ncbi:MAG: polymer-forming cytoskeletal protein [Spirochaetia bacterium]|jgi:cytoskeletal protein CcmA (bactofilin family)|nr:polymer-forming cytoskeletal protein [Spirochaetales bacterium]
MATRNDIPNNSVIGENSVFEGRFYVSGSILIEGKFDGEIKTEDHLTVGPTGKVKTDIYARKVTVAGTLIGNITASDEVDLLENGKVLGNINTPKLNVESGVLIQGMVTITGGQSENVTQVIRQSFGEEVESLISATERAVKKEKPKEPKPEPE